MQCLVFYPRGGSAQVVRYLSRALIDLCHEVHVATGTLSNGDPQHVARTFYGEIPLTLAKYTEAWRGFEKGKNPITPEWEVLFQDINRRFQPDLIHLHHINHMHLAAVEVFDDLLRASQLHGTEIKMLENLAHLEAEAHEEAQFQDLWRGIMAQAAESASHFFEISPDVRQRGMDEFGIEEWSNRGALSLSKSGSLSNNVDRFNWHR